MDEKEPEPAQVVEQTISGLSEAEQKKLAKKLERNHQYVLKQGYIWNPLIKLPRNSPCPCGSGKKYKRCHLKTMPRALPKMAAKKTEE